MSSWRAEKLQLGIAGGFGFTFSAVGAAEAGRAIASTREGEQRADLHWTTVSFLNAVWAEPLSVTVSSTRIFVATASFDAKRASA